MDTRFTCCRPNFGTEQLIFLTVLDPVPVQINGSLPELLLQFLKLGNVATLVHFSRQTEVLKARLDTEDRRLPMFCFLHRLLMY